MTAIEKAQAAWGDDLPDWVEALAKAWDGSSQKEAAEQIGYNAATVSAIISNSYKAGTAAIQKAVRGALMNAMVDCPVIGEMPAHECLDNQKRPFTPVNHIWVQMYPKCQGECLHSKKFKENAL